MNQFNRWDIWKNAGEPFVYETFFNACVDGAVLPPSIGVFVSHVGKLIVARANYPGVSDEDVMAKLVADNPKSMLRAASTMQETPILADQVTCCGGGAIK